MDILAALGIDLTTLLQGGALALVGGILGRAAIREFRRSIRRGLWRNIRRSETYRQLIGLLLDTWPYILLAVLAAWVNPALLLYIPVTIILASVARRLPWSTLIMYVLLVAGYALLAHTLTPPYGGAVVIITAAIRYAMPILWRKAR